MAIRYAASAGAGAGDAALTSQRSPAAIRPGLRRIRTHRVRHPSNSSREVLIAATLDVAENRAAENRVAEIGSSNVIAQAVAADSRRVHPVPTSSRRKATRCRLPMVRRLATATLHRRPDPLHHKIGRSGAAMIVVAIVRHVATVADPSKAVIASSVAGTVRRRAGSKRRAAPIGRSRVGHRKAAASGPSKVGRSKAAVTARSGHAAVIARSKAVSGPSSEADLLAAASARHSSSNTARISKTP